MLSSTWSPTDTQTNKRNHITFKPSVDLFSCPKNFRETGNFNNVIQILQLWRNAINMLKDSQQWGSKEYDVWTSSVTGYACQAVTYTARHLCDVTVSDKRIYILEVYMNSASWYFRRQSGYGRLKSLRRPSRLSCHHHVSSYIRLSCWRLFMCSGENAKMLVMFCSKFSRECQATKMLKLPRRVSIAKRNLLSFSVRIIIQNGALTVMLELTVSIVTTASNVMEGGICSNHCL